MKCANCGAELERVGSRFHCRFCDTYFEDLDGKHENEDVVARQGSFLSKCLDYEPEIFVPDGIAMIGNSAFANNLSIKIVHLPKTIQHIGDNAFTGCTNLSKIYGMEPVKTIGKEAFKNTGLESLTLSVGLSQVGEGCFSYCSKLETVRILLNKPIKFDRTFVRCSNLKKVEFDRTILFPSFKSNTLTVGNTNHLSTYYDAFMGTPFIHDLFVKFKESIKEGICPICHQALKKSLFKKECLNCHLYFPKNMSYINQLVLN